MPGTLLEIEVERPFEKDIRVSIMRITSNEVWENMNKEWPIFIYLFFWQVGIN